MSVTIDSEGLEGRAMSAALGHPESLEPAEHLLAGQGVNLSSLAHRAISEMIRDRRLKGGEAIIEARLADTLGISRTPLREALQRLEGEGLVRKVANRSYVVRHVDLGEYLHSLKVREILEGEAAALATGGIPGEKLAATRHEIRTILRSTAYHTHAHWQSDDNLHGLYIDHCGNPVMAYMIRALRVATRLFEIAKLKDRLEPDSTEHLAILEALEAGDKRAARTAVQLHCRSLRDFALATVR
jgi:DNA-binding GntR family transcriptional regulator